MLPGPAKDQFAFRNFAERLWKEIIEKLATTKGNQYTDTHNAFENFEQHAKAWDTDVPQAILQLAQKHWSYMIRWTKLARAENGRMAKARESAGDLIVYLLLLLFWISTQEKE